VKNDISPDDISLDGIEGIVISPGPETPEKANRLNEILAFLIGKRPILGICLGHQAIGVQLGARLVKAQKPMHGKISNIKARGGFLFTGIPDEFDVVRYHSLVLENLPMELKPLAVTDQGELMAFEFLEARVCGIQFHPEAALTEYGLKILRNWLTFYHIV
jgi:anthranilate synthase/aminodeoxychorismate synthase-like glutamine amidotransferase